MDTAPGELSSIPRYRCKPVVGHLFRVEIQILGADVSHQWRGFADDSDQARRRGLSDARQAWPGRSLCVRNVAQVGL